MMNKIRILYILRQTLKIFFGVLLFVFVWGCANVPGLREETTGTYIRVPFVRVLLKDSEPKVSLSARSSFAVECISAGKQSVYYSTRPVVVLVEQGKLTVENDKQLLIQKDIDEINIIPRGKDNRVSVDKKRYRGIVQCRPDGGNVELINIVYVEDYLRGVVPAEIGPRTEQEVEAVKAQAVAARTYTMSHLQQYEGEQYDMKSTIIDQVYEGFDSENKLVNTAVDATAGQVAVYQDQFINAYYHSTCGGMTDNIADVWERIDIAYLKAVADSGACSWSKYYTWSESYTEQQLRGRIEQYLSNDRGRDMRVASITDVVIRDRSAGGRVLTLSVRTQDEVYKFHKDRIRWVIGRTSNPDLILPSARFDVDISRSADGQIENIVFRGKGYGHGVGMCQCGAIGLSRTGSSFEAILKHYYAGIEIRKYY
jgi:stage II sporulation protein D